MTFETKEQQVLTDQSSFSTYQPNFNKIHTKRFDALIISTPSHTGLYKESTIRDAQPKEELETQEKRPSTGGTFSDGYILIANVPTSLSADELQKCLQGVHFGKLNTQAEMQYANQK